MKTACMFQKQRFKIVYRKSGVVYPGLEFQPELPEQINEFLVFGSWFKELQPQHTGYRFTKALTQIVKLRNYFLL